MWFIQRMILVKTIKRIMIASVLVYITALAVIWYARIGLIYPFSLQATYKTPLQAGVPQLTEKNLITEDGETLILWVHPAKGRKATFIYFHGNAGSLSGRANRFNELTNRGYGIVAIAYRGSSGSTGQPSEVNITMDSKLLIERLPTILGKAPTGKIIYYGESLGTGVAAKLALANPPDALILEAPYTSIVSLAAMRMPYFPIRLILEQRWETENYIKKVRVPTLVIHGTRDQVIPYGMGESIFALSGSTAKQMKTIRGGNHLSAFTTKGQAAIYRFVEGL